MEKKARFCTIGVDVGGTKIRSSRFEQNQLKATHYILVDHTTNVLDQIIQSIRAVYTDSVTSIGICLPGLVDRERARVLPHLPSLQQYNIAQIIHKLFHAQTVLINDADAYTLAEYLEQKKRHPSIQSFIGITLGTGVGAGIILQNQLLLGRGEVGHWVDTNGVPFEQLCNGQSLTQTYYSLTRQLLTPKEIFESTDPNAQTAILSTATHVGRLCAMLANELSVDAICIGGSIAHKQLVKYAAMIAKRERMSDVIPLHIYPARLKEQASTFGSAIFAQTYTANTDTTK